jgi:hypothetical protein
MKTISTHKIVSAVTVLSVLALIRGNAYAMHISEGGLVNRCVKSHQAAILSSTFDSHFMIPSTNTFPS